jgi:hypothetical protein
LNTSRGASADHLKYFVSVLTAEDGHYFNDAIIADAIINTIDAADAPPVSLAKIVNCRIGVRPLGYFLKTVKQSVVIAVCGRFAPLFPAIEIYAS